MATYAIGDVQGCFDELQTLLKKINFNPQVDQLWFVGDLVNRGPKSLEVLRFVKNLPQTKIVLGNHDLHLIALAYGNPYPDHTLNAVLTAPDREELIEWLRRLPLLHHDEKLNFVMVHAGIYPLWNLNQAKTYAQEFETALHSEKISELLKNMYGDQPDQWNENLAGEERLRFIVNTFTRMRFCTPAGKLEFHNIGKINSVSQNYLPWFKIPNRATKNLNIIFGHWAALQGETGEPKVFALDTGCVWGNCLTAMRLQDQEKFSVNCSGKCSHISSLRGR